MELRKNITLLTENNVKTIKGEKMDVKGKLGIKTLILYLSPYTNNSKGINLCPHASAGCSKACLFNSGNARFNQVQAGRLNKTEYFLSDRAGFMQHLVDEIRVAVKKYRKDWKIAIRLNGTSDIAWEKIKIGGKNIFEIFPNVTFYDYTKNPIRFEKEQPKNYHLTFSRSEDNEAKAIELLNKGYNVAWVMNRLVKEHLGFKVIDGDKSDARFKDKKGVIVSLRYKNVTTKNASALNLYSKTSGFVTFV
jgi:hypothetical protein